MRLIDADELKKDLICFYPEGVPSGLDSETMFNQILHDIDNAPTIKPSLNLDNITEDDIEKFKTIWQRATSKGVILETERAQGEWNLKEDDNYLGGGYTKCTNCGMKYSWGGYHEVFEFAYCPTCGAKMIPTETLSETAGKVADDCLNRIMGGGI